MKQRRFQRLADDLDAHLLVLGEPSIELVERLLGADQGDAAAGHDALFDGRAGRRERVLDAELALLQLDFGGRADLDHGDAAGQLGQPLLQLLAVELGGGVLGLGLDLLDAGLDRLVGAVALDDDGLFLGGDDAAGAAEVAAPGRSPACGPCPR